MQRWLLLLLGACCIVLASSGENGAQPADEPDEPEEYWASYSLEGLLADYDRDPNLEESVPRVSPVLASGPLWPEYGERNRYDDSWNLRRGLRRDSLTENDLSLGLAFEIAINHVTQAETKLHTTPTAVLEVWANEDGHKLTQQIFEALREWFSLRSEVSLYRLAESRPGCVLDEATVADALKSATLLGRQTGEAGETLVWRELEFTTCLNDYDVPASAEDPTPQMIYTRYPRGWEVAAGVLPSADGRLLVQGYAGTASVTQTRKLRAGRWDVEVPSIASRLHPATASIAPGEGLLLDGRYLLLPGLSGTVRARRYRDTFVTLPIALVRIANMIHGAWPGDIKAEAGYPETHMYDGVVLIQPNGVGLVQEATTEFRTEENLHASYVECVGPLIVIQGEELIDPEDREADTEFEETIVRLSQGPQTIHYEVALFGVNASELTREQPTADWLRAKGKSVASYSSVALSGQVADWHDLQAETYYACGDNVWWSVPTIDPILRTAVAGTRVRLLATGDRIDVAAAYAPSLEIKQSAVADPTGGKAESATVPTAHLRLQEDLKPGEAASSVVPYPGDDSKRLVLFVKRVK